MFEVIADNVICLIVPLTVIVTLVLLFKFQKPSPPPVEEQSIDYQQKVINGLLGDWSDLKNSFVEAISDGATHAVYHEDVMKFYRTDEDEFEFRSLVFTPAPSWYWGSDWEKCNEIPHYALQISDKF